MKIQAILGSIALHTSVLVAGGTLLITPAQYGVESGAGGIDVDLVAAPLAPEEKPMLEPVVADSSVADEFVEPIDAAEEVVPALPQEAPSSPSPVYGDGTSAIPGQDAVTLQGSSGAITEAKPKYLKNPAPHYPESARQRGEEGLVVLMVEIDLQGKVKELVIKQSSGYAALDMSASKAVRKWKFEPARLGSITLESRVEVPVRFRLDEK